MGPFASDLKNIGVRELDNLQEVHVMDRAQTLLKPQDSNRDLRIDFIRGAALFLIFTSHLTPNIFKKFNPTALSFWDGAEVFVFISGYVCGLAYGKSLSKGFFVCCLAVSRRCLEIYGSLLLTLVLTLGLLSIFFGPASFDVAKASLFLTDPPTAFARFCQLSYFPWAFNILPMYLAILISLPMMLWIRNRAGLSIMVTLSALLYLAVQLWPTTFRLPPPRDQSWYFNVFAWQFVFYLGVAAQRLFDYHRFGLFPKPRAVVYVACALVGLMILIKVAHAAWYEWQYFADTYNILVRGGTQSEPFLQHRLPWTHKPTVGPLRIVSFMIVVFVATTLIPRHTRFWHSRLAEAVIKCGQHSLPVFCCGTVLVNLANSFMATHSNSVFWQGTSILFGWAAMVAFTFVWSALFSIKSNSGSAQFATAETSSIAQLSPVTSIETNSVLRNESIDADPVLKTGRR